MDRNSLYLYIIIDLLLFFVSGDHYLRTSLETPYATIRSSSETLGV